MAEVVGYARVSTRSQSVDSQVEKLGCCKIRGGAFMEQRGA